MKKSITTLSLALLCLTLLFSFTSMNELENALTHKVTDETSSPEKTDQVRVYLDWENNTPCSFIGYWSSSCGAPTCQCNSNFNYDFPTGQNIDDINPLVDISHTPFSSPDDVGMLCLYEQGTGTPCYGGGAPPLNCQCICITQTTLPNGTVVYSGSGTVSCQGGGGPYNVTIDWTAGQWPVRLRIF